MTHRVTLIDYGIGNLHSVFKALRHLGAEVAVASDARAVDEAERIVLPGVGAFEDGIQGLKQRGILDAILRWMERGRPFLGICLGMQLLLGESEEFGLHRGMGIIPGRVVAIQRLPGLKVPQIGWNRISPPEGVDWKESLLQPIAPGTMVYFVHSFTAVPANERHRLADSDYGGQRISAVVRKDNVVGCQFHPEKSGEAGLLVLDRFLSV
jgi:glutamine amidotransferase